VVNGSAQKFWLICSLALAGFVGTLALLGAWPGDHSEIATRTRGLVEPKVTAAPPSPSAAGVMRRQSREPENPAMQRPGPPDPMAQQSAAASAESAAEMAARAAAQ